MSNIANHLSEGLNLIEVSPSDALRFFTQEIFASDDFEAQLEAATTLWLNCFASNPEAAHFLKTRAMFVKAIEYFDEEKLKLQEGTYDPDIDGLLDSLLDFVKAALQIVKFYPFLSADNSSKVEFEILYDVSHCDVAIKALREAHPDKLTELESIRQFIDKDRARYA